MKATVIIITLIALYRLYRIAHPKRMNKEKEDDTLQKSEPDLSDVVIKSRFVRPEKRQIEPTSSTPLQTDLQEEKLSNFASGNECGNGKKNAVIPPEMLDELFSEEEPDPKDLDIDEDDETKTVEDLEEEAEDLPQSMGTDTELANGWSIEELTEAAEAVNNPTDEQAAILFKVEKTDMFEQLVSDDERKMEWIRAIIDRHVRNLYPEVENEVQDNGKSEEWMNFDVQSLLDTGIND